MGQADARRFRPSTQLGEADRSGEWEAVLCERRHERVEVDQAGLLFIHSFPPLPPRYFSVFLEPLSFLFVIRLSLCFFSIYRLTFIDAHKRSLLRQMNLLNQNQKWQQQLSHLWACHQRHLPLQARLRLLLTLFLVVRSKSSNPTDSRSWRRWTALAKLSENGRSSSSLLAMALSERRVCSSRTRSGHSLRSIEIYSLSLLLTIFAPRRYVPTVFDNYSGKIDFEGKEYIIGLWDTAGYLIVLFYSYSYSYSYSYLSFQSSWFQFDVYLCDIFPFLLIFRQESYDRLRPLSYPNTDCFLLCFSVVNPESFENIKKKWKDEVIHHCPSAKRLLVGTKKDLRDNPETLSELAKQGTRPIATADAEKQKGAVCCERYVGISLFLFYFIFSFSFL